MIGKSALGPVTVAIYHALNVPSFLALSTNGVYNAIPQGTQFPFTLIAKGDPPEEKHDTFSRCIRTVRIELHFYSDWPGDDQVDDMGNEAARLLEYVNLPIAGWDTLIITSQEGANTPEDFNGVIIRHAVLPFAVQVGESR